MDNPTLPRVNEAFTDTSFEDRQLEREQLMSTPHTDVNVTQIPTTVDEVKNFISSPQNIDVAADLLEKALRDGDITQADYKSLKDQLISKSTTHPEAPLN